MREVSTQESFSESVFAANRSAAAIVKTLKGGK